MIFCEILSVVLMVVWWGVALVMLYQVGYDTGERAGRAQGCRCRNQPGGCPCQRARQSGEAEAKGGQ